ncbi:MAG: hypothetical protein A2151_04065 [Candidatus Muproteobacteria bacterium RBG_16_65_34]|uniref:Uncharacterized protein n=1 Tax=Candidatus Muproteobacteria bacterium RBG_16_65_34 TaxID=1817760 RepID=A0A1F6TTH8_9PROT|nr:MAG: hypothetical protein A2151_04065 [Candidatus Muproteobacteria bacterium RBG_16_65_34]
MSVLPRLRRRSIWRFCENARRNLSLALKPGVTFATGGEADGLGAGKFNYPIKRRLTADERK